MNFPVLTHLNQIIGILRGNLVTVGLSLCGLIGVVAIISILLNQDMSPAARTNRWEWLIRVFICVGLLASLVAFIGFAQQFGGAL